MGGRDAEARALSPDGTPQPVGPQKQQDPGSAGQVSRAILLTPEGRWDTGEVTGQHIG